MVTATETATYDVVSESYGRCLATDAFIETFYDILLEGRPDVASMFAETDFVQQRQLLRAGIGVMLMFRRGDNTARLLLEGIRKSHSRKYLNVRPELYDYWVDSLTNAIAKHDPLFSPDLERAWRAVLAGGIAFLRDGYDVDYRSD